MIAEICKLKDVEIMKGHVASDHIHIFVSVPLYISVSKLMQSIKGKTSRKMLMEHKKLSRTFWGQKAILSQFGQCYR